MNQGPGPLRGVRGARSRFLGVAAAALLAGVSAGGPVSAAGPPKTLAECVDIALANQPRLGSAAAAVESGKQRVLQTRANYLPQITAGYAADRRDGSPTTTTVGGTSFESSPSPWFHSAGFSLSQLLFDFGQNLDRIRAARARAESLQADAVTQRDNIIFNAKQAYFVLLAARRLLEVAQETVRSNRQQVEQARGRYDVGFAAKIDVTRSEVQLATSELDEITARNNVAVAQDTLRNALGLDEPLDFDIVDVLDIQRVVKDEAEMLETAYAARPELESNKLLQRALEEEILARQKDHLPNVTGNATYDWSGNRYPLRSGWVVGAQLNVPLFTGGRTTAQVAESRADLEALRFDEITLRQDIALQVRTALLEVQRTSDSIDVTQRAAEQARENLQLAEGRYSTGVGNIIELTDAQVQRARADADRVRALYSYQTAVASLELAVGRPVTQP